MSQPAANLGRRRLIALALGCASGCGAVAFAQEVPQRKVSQQEAQYQTKPQDIRSCGSCSLFEPPNACKVVLGTISKSGWCKLYVGVD